MNIKFSLKTDLNKEEIINKAKLVLFHSMVKMHELATNNASVNMGALRASIKLFPSQPGAESYTLADGVEYGIHVEYGTSPHYVSPKHLMRWAKLKLGDENAAYAVAKKIAKEGTEAKPFFRPALDQVKNIWIQRYWEKDLAK